MPIGKIKINYFGFIISLLGILLLIKGCNQNNKNTFTDNRSNSYSKTIVTKKTEPFSKNSELPQLIDDSKEGLPSTVSVEIKPGSLILDTDIVLENSFSTDLEDLSKEYSIEKDNEISTTNSIKVITSTVPQDLVYPMTISLEIPEDNNQSFLSLFNFNSNYFVVYTVYVKDADLWKRGIITSDRIAIKDNRALFSSRYFGKFELFESSQKFKIKPNEKIINTPDFKNPPLELKNIHPLVSKPGENIKISGKYLSDNIKVTINNKPISDYKFISSNEISFSMPALSVGIKKVNVANNSKSGNLNIFSNSGSLDHPIITMNKEDVCQGITYYNSNGDILSGEKNCTGPAYVACSENGQNGCITSDTYKPLNITNIDTSKIVDGYSILDKLGTYQPPSYPNCDGNGQLGCLTTGIYTSINPESVDTDSLTEGYSLLGKMGTIPVCSANNQERCLTDSTYTSIKPIDIDVTKIKSGYNIAGKIGLLPECVSNYQIGCVTGSGYPAADLSLIDGSKILIGTSIVGVSGSYTPSATYESCSSDGETSCVTNSGFKAVDMSFNTPGNIRTGITIGGIEGKYPSNEFPMINSSSSISDLTGTGVMSGDLASNITYEFWNSSGIKQTVIGTTDLSAENILLGKSIGGISGNLVIPSDCNSNGQKNCKTNSTYRAANISNLTAGNIKKGVVIAGQMGDYPSLSHPLPNASNTEDLTSISTQLTNNDSFEFWSSNGARFIGSGDSDLIASNIKTGISLENLSIMGTHASSQLEFTKIATGEKHSCALTASGKAYCWGENNEGQLGEGASNGNHSTPIAVIGGYVFTDIVAGSKHTCGLVSSGQAYCWGKNNCGQLGDNGSNSDQLSPVAVSEGLQITSIGAGKEHTCGLSSSGQAYCWGRDNYGQLGDGSSITDQSSPSAVSGGLVFVSLDIGLNHSCGVVSSGLAYCWGKNDRGQLGDGGSNSDQSEPISVNGGMSFTSLSAGENHTCGLHSSGQAYCWGRDDRGQLGDSLASNDQSSPVSVAGGHIFTSVESGSEHSCGLKSSGEAYCWGRDNYGQLGNAGSNVDQSTPVSVSEVILFSTLALGFDQSCGLLSTGEGYCWGRNDKGQLGDNGSNSDLGSPKQINMAIP